MPPRDFCDFLGNFRCKTVAVRAKNVKIGTSELKLETRHFSRRMQKLAKLEIFCYDQVERCLMSQKPKFEVKKAVTLAVRAKEKV